MFPKSKYSWLAGCYLHLLVVGWMGDFAKAQVVISEFMAKNDSGLVDGDGEYSDWIELYNTGDDTVDLTGWYLSDKDDNLQKWEFPEVRLGAGEYLVIIASSQDVDDYVDALGYLHTNFALSGDGENVMLTQADGVTIEDSIVDYPEQSDDVSYGIPSDATFTTLVASDAEATAFVPSDGSDGSTWQLSGYDDSAWLSGELGVGYDTSSDYTSAIGLNVQTMRGSNGSVYVRVPFEVSDADSVSSLSLRMKYDDGFVAYLNGIEVARVNAPTTLSYNSLAAASQDADLDDYEDFDLTSEVGSLQDGENILAFQAMNVPINSSDLLLVAELNAASGGDLQIGTLSYLPTPTPGASNLAGFEGYVEDTKFSVDRGFYSEAFEVEITCETEGSSIYYTVDGTTPTSSNGVLYSGPVTIEKTTVLRAAAYRAGYQPSDVDTQTYLFLDDIIAQDSDVTSLDPYFPPTSVNGQGFDYGMDPDITESSEYSDEIQGALLAIPSISMVTDPENLFDSSSGIYVNASESGDEWERETSIELIQPDGSEGFQINGGVRIRGASSTVSSNPKHSFRFFFRSEYGESHLEYPLFGEEGVDRFKRVDLRTGQNFSWANQSPQYATWLYDIFTRDTHRDMDQPYTRGEYYHLYINGMYWGLYQTEERCNADYAASYYGGEDDDYDAVKSDSDTGEMYAVDGTRDAYDSLWSAVNSGVTSNADYFELQGKNADGTENEEGTCLLDVDNVIDYMLLVYFTANRDSPIGPPNRATMPRNLNAIFNRNDPDGFKFVAHDNEHSLEISEGVNHNRFTQSLGNTFNSVEYFTPWWLHLELMENEEYALRFADRVYEYFFNDGVLTTANNQARMETRKTEIYSAVVAESARWGDSQSTSPRTRNDDWQTWADWLTDTYFAQRTSIVFSQIESQGWYPSVDPPVFSQHGGSIETGDTVSMTGSGTIYYTVDGSDPRAVGGSVAGVAGSELVLTESTQVNARCLSGGVWSAMTSATFEVSDLSPLRVTEMMYHPAEASSDAEVAFGDEEFEFIELLNTGSESIGLSGVEFSGGIYFSFAEGEVLTLDPGEYVLVVNDMEAFAARYSNAESLNIAGEYHGKFYLQDGELDNGGEAITLVDSLGREIQEFTYVDDWYPSTDGEGYSLTLTDPTADVSTWSSSSAWHASLLIGGTPGEDEVDENLDADEDGLPDSWELEFFGSTDEEGDGDWDHDGSSNYTEYVADTDPTDPTSSFVASATLDSGIASLSFQSSSDRVYSLWRSLDLSEGSWEEVDGQVEVVGSGDVDTLMDSAPPGDRCFYRIEVTIAE
ncbi:MAG: lamin tail domain-containing protein [Verrucomicrobiales bacterium]